MSGALRVPARAGVIRYMGNKRALAGVIRRAAERLADAGSLAVDPMAGSHAVTIALKDRHRFVASDAQEYSAVVGRGWLDNAGLPRVEERHLRRLRRAVDEQLAAPGAGFLEQAFSDTYLGARQCRELDALRAAVERVFPDHADPRRWLSLGALFTAACRGQATPGHFAQFLRPDHPRTRALRRVDLVRTAFDALESMQVPPGRAGSRSHALRWRGLVAERAPDLADATLWYLDPPYTRDQYSRFYHFLETLAKGDEPALAYRARYRQDRFRSSFCSPRTAAGELRALLEAIRGVSPRARVLLSYSSRGLLSRAELTDAAAGTFRLLFFEEHEHAYSTQGKGRLDGVREWLLGFDPA